VRDSLMSNALKDVLNAKRDLLANNKVKVSFTDGQQEGSYSANLDSTKYVGTITYWPDSRFEFQFNSCKSGDVVILDTKEFQTESELATFIEDLFATKLI